MKVLHLALNLLLIFTGVVIYYLSWENGIGQILTYLYNDVNTKVEEPSSNIKYNILLRNSSVWCWGSTHLDRICYFNNLYFHSNKFFFVHGKDSLYHGLPENQFNPALLDLSSVHDHNGQYFNYIDVIYEKSTKLFTSAIQVPNLTFALHRFHPDNLMHVFHDDLIPLFKTLEIFAPFFQWNIEDIQLIFIDKRSPGKYKDLYETMFSKKPFYRTKLPHKAICFSKILMGLVKNTTWYQYGFVRPQGPLEHQVNGFSLKTFIYFMRKKYSLEKNPEILVESAVLLVRKLNRLILNEIELTYKLVHDLGLKVEVVSQETHSLVEIISKISTAGVLIGMHGSLLILSLFLPAGAMLLELFPYAVNPNNYTPYRTLVSLPGFNITYASWRNFDAKKTRTHPNRAPYEGGIRHLHPKEQEVILSSGEVPLHLCCDDPQWLFRIYQDTEVNVNEIVELVAKHRKHFSVNRSPIQNEILQRKLLPYRIESIKCSSNGAHNSESILSISWDAPMNIDSVAQEGFVYELWLQELGTESYLTFHSSMNSCKVTSNDGIKKNTSYYVWIRGIAQKDAVGPFNNFKLVCTVD